MFFLYTIVLADFVENDVPKGELANLTAMTAERAQASAQKELDALDRKRFEERQALNHAAGALKRASKVLNELAHNEGLGKKERNLASAEAHLASQAADAAARMA